MTLTIRSVKVFELTWCLGPDADCGLLGGWIWTMSLLRDQIWIYLWWWGDWWQQGKQLQEATGINAAIAQPLLPKHVPNRALYPWFWPCPHSPFECLWIPALVPLPGQVTRLHGPDLACRLYVWQVTANDTRHNLQFLI